MGHGHAPWRLICVASIFSLYIGSWGTLAGAERLGAKAFPFGAGASGMSARCAQWLDTMKPAAFYGTPTYALHLARPARDEGLDPRGFGLSACFSRASRALDPGRARQDRGVLGAKVFDCGSMAEMTPWMNVAGSAETDGMLCWQDVVYTEVCDPASFDACPMAREAPGLHPSRADLAADDPAALGRPYAVGERSEPVRPHLSSASAWASSAASTTCSRLEARTSIRARSTPFSTTRPDMAGSTGSSSRARARWTSSLLRVEAVPEIWQAAQRAARASEPIRGSGAEDARACGPASNRSSAFPRRTDFKARRVLDDRADLPRHAPCQVKAASS